MPIGSFKDGGLEAFNSNADAIERVLGELMGLELARDYADRDQTIGMVGSDVEWNVPSETNPFLIVVAVNDPSRSYEEAVSHVREQFRTCWDNGRSWATGIADQIKRYGKLYGDVDVKALADVAESLESRVALQLSGALTGNWSYDENRGTDLETTLGNFSGEFAGKLNAFYSNVGDRANVWATFASSLAAGYAGTAVVIDRCQRDMTEWALKTRRHCEAQLQNWADAGGFGILVMQRGGSVNGAETLATLSKMVNFGASVASLFPPAAAVAGPTRTVSGIVTTILEHTGGDAERPVTLTAQESLEIWGWEDSGGGAQHELGHEIIDGCTQALYELRQGSADGGPTGTADVTAEVERRVSDGSWYAPRPQGMSDPDPSDLWYKY